MQGRLKMVHFWAGSFVIVAFPPLELHMRRNKEKDTQGQRWRMFPAACPPLRAVPHLLSVHRVVAPVVLLLLPPLSFLLLFLLLILAIISFFFDSSRVEKLVMDPYQCDLIILCFGSLPRCLHIASGWVSVVKLSKCASGVPMSK